MESIIIEKCCGDQLQGWSW